jgi:hypothetical protein
MTGRQHRDDAASHLIFAVCAQVERRLMQE